MICKKCGKELKDDACFCSGCGAVTESEPKIEEAVPVVAEVAEVPPSEEPVVQETAAKEEKVVKKSGKKKKIVFVTILICFIILVGIVLLWFLSKDKNPENTESLANGNETENVTESTGDKKGDDAGETGNQVQPGGSEEMSLVDAKMSQERSVITFTEDVGNVVSDGKNTYVYAEGFIYRLDKEGNATPLCAVEKQHYAYDYGYYPTYVALQLYEGVLYYRDNDRIMAYDPAKGYAECLIEDDFIYEFYVVGKYVYYHANGCINKYGIDEKTLVQSLESSYIAGRNPHAEDEIIIRRRDSLYDTDPVTGETTNWRPQFTYGYSDLKEVSGTQSFELAWSELDTYDMTTKNYIYLYDIVINTRGYEEERVYKVPSVIVEDDWLNMLEFIEETEPKYASLFKDYYKKYDINNLGNRDKDIQDELLACYPILAEKIIYVLRPTTKSNVKVKFEEIFENAGIVDELMEKAAELDKNPPDESQKKDLFRLICINPETLQEEYRIEQPVYISRVLGYYENDLIVYAYIDNVVGLYRIPERSLWECGLNGQPLQAELILAVETDLSNMGKYAFDVNPTDEYLYYTVNNSYESYSDYGKLKRIKWDKGILPEGTAEVEMLTDLYSDEGFGEKDPRYASVWVDGVEFRVLGYPDNESQLVKVAADEYIVQMVLPRSMDFTQYKLTAWQSDVRDGQETINYYFMRSDSEALCISFVSGTGVQETFEASYNTAKGEGSVTDFQTVNGKGYTVQSSMVIPDTMYSMSMPIECCTAMIYDSSLQVICSVTLLNNEDEERQLFESKAGEIVFGECSDANMLYRTSIVGEDYDKRMETMYAKYKEIMKDPDTYMAEVCENPGTEFDYHYLFDLTRDGVPEIIYMGNPRWICIVGEKNAINLSGSTVVFGSEPGTFYAPMFWTGSGAWTKYKVTADEQGYLVLETLEAEYLAANQGVFTYRGNVIDEQEFYDKENQLDSCYMPNAILYYWGMSASEGQFYNSVKRIAPEEIQ